MPFLIVLPAIISFLLLGAHILHNGGSVFLALACVGLSTLLVSRHRWLIYVVQIILTLATIEWLATTYDIIIQRQAAGLAWERAAVILIGVAGLNVAAAALLFLRKPH
ncbi:MAG TPA: hypothetical protein VM008_14160 [Phycisphaerae bacterium]|nr:hypothetical protein [Phycisphaerae bacterium]